MGSTLHTKLCQTASFQHEKSFSPQRRCKRERLKHPLLSKSFFKIAVLAVFIFGQQPLTAKSKDGFATFCTSNHDSTGECINQEDGRSFQCLIVPGQIISCPSRSLPAECAWISNTTANQAMFWCDPEDESLLYEEMPSDSMLDDLNPAPQTDADAEDDLNPAEVEIFKNVF